VRLKPIDPTSLLPAPWRVFPLCLISNVLLRLPSFFRSVLDWDESLYVLIAGQILSGHLPYTTIWDNKPPGIYVIFALFEALFRDPVIAIRAATVVFVSLDAVIVWRLTHVLLAGAPARLARRGAWLAAAGFTLGALSNDGLSANTELFMAGFSAAAILAAIDPGFCTRHPLRRATWTGLLFGLACMVKYVAVFEAPAVAFALLLATPSGWRAGVQKSAAAIAGALILPAMTVTAYAAAGQIPLLWSCSIAANFARVAVPFSLPQLHAAAFTILPRWLPAVFASCAVLVSAPFAAIAWRRGAAMRAATFGHVLLALWLLGGALGVISAKSFYDHYFLQILPAASIALALVTARLFPAFGRISRFSAALLAMALLFIPARAGYWSLIAAIQPLRAPQGGFQPDTPARIAATLRPKIAAGATLYVFDSQPIIYALTGAAPPTRFVLPSVLTRCFLARVAGVNAPAEVARILSSNPDFIITQAGTPQTPDPDVYAEFNADIQSRYRLWQRLPDAVIYSLRPGAPVGAVIPAPDHCR
jgi:4-amino-4-deoxy-L-arabinose transferase-like glycosyltransferase